MWNSSYVRKKESWCFGFKISKGKLILSELEKQWQNDVTPNMAPVKSLDLTVGKWRKTLETFMLGK